MLLIRQPRTHSVLKLDSEGPNPVIPADTDFWSITKTYDELSLVCVTGEAPKVGVMERSDNWCAFRVAGTMEFTLTGVVAQISQVLADAHLGIFVVSTFDTDFILVASHDADAAVDKWREVGIEVVEPLHQTTRLDFIDFNYELEDIAHNNRQGKTWVDDYPTKGDTMIANLSLTAQLDSSQEVPMLFALRSRSTGLAIGSIGFKGEHIDAAIHAREIGYELVESERLKGLGTEAIAGLIEIARTRGVKHLCAKTDPLNIPSQKALARNGFVELLGTGAEIMWEFSIPDKLVGQLAE